MSELLGFFVALKFSPLDSLDRNSNPVRKTDVWFYCGVIKFNNPLELLCIISYKFAAVKILQVPSKTTAPQS